MGEAVGGYGCYMPEELELITKSQVGNAGIGDAALPCQLECLKIGKMLQNFEPTICQTTTGVLVQIQMLQLWHARQVQQAVIGELSRAAETQTGDMIEL